MSSQQQGVSSTVRQSGLLSWSRLLLVSSIFLLSACNIEQLAEQLHLDNKKDDRNNPPEILQVSIGDNQQADLDLVIFHTDAESDTVDLEISFSRDGGASWQPANLKGYHSNIFTAEQDGETRITWRRLKDTGFRHPAQTLIRVLPTDATGQRGEALSVTTPPIDSPRLAALEVDYPIIYYGGFDQDIIRHMETYQLAVVHPTIGELTRESIAAIQDGVNPADPRDDVIVLCYISVGEDLRTVAVSDEEMRNDPRFRGDGSGPRIDPRGVNMGGRPLSAIDPLGAPSPGGSGFASWYLDDNSVTNDPLRIGDGLPDRNSIFGAAFVNAGDPAWFDTLQEMTFDDSGIFGIREILTTGYGRGLGCDGLFLDTIDTAAPNSFTDAGSPNQSEFEWTAPGFSAFLERLRNTYPDAVLKQNRGLFFFNPDFPHYLYNAGRDIDLLLFESYRLDSNTSSELNPYFFSNNKYNYLPKIAAEANRPDGFKVISLGYAEGPVDRMARATLRNQNSLGRDSLLLDIFETQDLAGFRHYITDAGITYVNDFVRQYGELSDSSPPLWSSTYNANRRPYPQPHEAPEARIGIQQVVPQQQGVLVRWDVALDKHRVRYVIYYQDLPFDFSQQDPLSQATRLPLEPEPGDGYALGTGTDSYPYQAYIGKLQPATRYYFLIRAVDNSPDSNEDNNEVVLSATTL